MSLAVLGLALLVAAVALGWKAARPACGVVAGLLLGVIIAGSDGTLADMAHAFVAALRTGLNGLASYIFGGK